MNYYQTNKDKILKKAYEKYHNGGGKEKARKYYRENKEEIKKKEREKYRKSDKFEKKRQNKKTFGQILQIEKKERRK